jgi:hypothetical protein
LFTTFTTFATFGIFFGRNVGGTFHLSNTCGVGFAFRHGTANKATHAIGVEFTIVCKGEFIIATLGFNRAITASPKTGGNAQNRESH